MAINFSKDLNQVHLLTSTVVVESCTQCSKTFDVVGIPDCNTYDDVIGVPDF